MRVGILGDKAGVMGGDAAEPMGSSRGHLQETARKKICQWRPTTPGDKRLWKHQTTCHYTRWAVGPISSAVKSDQISGL